MAYCERSDVRKGFLEKREFYTGNTGLSVTLGDNYTESLTEVKKNGSVDTTWTFTPPATVTTTGSALVSTDYLEIKRAVFLSDTELDEIITDADAIIDSYLAKAYTLPLSETPAIIATKAEMIAHSLAIKELSDHPEYSPSAGQVEQADKDLAECKAWFEALLRGEYELVDSAKDVIARKDNFREVTTFVGIDDSTEEV